MTSSGPTIPAHEVERARAELREQVDDLTTIGHHKWLLEDGTMKHATTPPLLAQIAAEVAGNSQNQGGNSWRSKPPLWFDGSMLLADVDRWAGGYDGDTREQQVRAWCNDVASNGAPIDIVDARDVTRSWVGGCKALLDPKPKFRLRGQACPNCGNSKVWDRTDEDNDENHARPALEIDTERGVCVCLACDEEWAPAMWEHLRMVLEQQQHETLAVTGYDTSVRARTNAEAGGNTYR